jgi:hypothetical protein
MKQKQESLNARIYNGLDARVGYPVITYSPPVPPVGSGTFIKKPWWKKLFG